MLGESYIGWKSDDHCFLDLQKIVPIEGKNNTKQKRLTIAHGIVLLYQVTHLP